MSVFKNPTEKHNGLSNPKPKTSAQENTEDRKLMRYQKDDSEEVIDAITKWTSQPIADDPWSPVWTTNGDRILNHWDVETEGKIL
ncbi:hypothetical protein DL95DRAFT_466303 [Leptodontidium sp. 2 PMI_412]|nr:hypothetical protein DL95DRAFT_466303 [Leptodontidium sp. 2 PMI_412]